MKQMPMLMESPLTKRVFVVTSYKDNGDGTFTARKKFDVTEQFDALAERRRGGALESLVRDMHGWLSDNGAEHFAKRMRELGIEAS